MKNSLLVVLALAGLIGCGPREQTSESPAPVPEPSAPVQASLDPKAWVVPVDVTNAGNNPTQDNWSDLAWQSFIAINWPAVAPSATSNPGQPDTQSTLGASASGGALIPTVWLTYRDLAGTFLPKGADPGSWGSVPFEPVPSGCQPIQAGSVAPGFSPMVLDMISKVDAAPIPEDEIDEAGAGPLIDQLGRYAAYDVRLNQAEFTYIQMPQTRYYDAVNQVNAFKPPSTGIVALPRNGQETYFNPPLPSYAQFGVLEVKASWRVLDSQKDVFSRYYTQTGYFLQPDGKTCEGPVTFGLVGLHILRLTPTTPSTWYWATFEQVDNTDAPAGVKRPDGSPLTASFSPAGTPNGNCPTTGYNVSPPAVTGNIPWTNTNTPVNVCRVTPISAAVAAINAKWQGKVAGTVWANYELIDTVNPAVTGNPSYPFPPINDPGTPVNTDVMANSTMETYFQTTSCMSCHGSGTPQGAPSTVTSANQIFTFVLQNAGSSNPSLRVKRPSMLGGLVKGH
jgi:hypothetical protein